MRSYDVMDFVSYSISVQLAEQFIGRDENFIVKMDAMEKWTDIHCEGDYIIMLGSVMFNNEADAIIFKLKYG